MLSIYSYTGKDSTCPKSNDSLSTRVVEKMVGIVYQYFSFARHRIFFDNFFTSYQLMANLAQRNSKVIATVRENRTAGAYKAMTSSKELSKKNRGSFHYRSDGTVFFCKSNNNYFVNTFSNFATHKPI